MPNDVLYSGDVVLKMLLAAYQAGFEGPLELAEQDCRDILAKGTYQESDLELIEFMQERERKKQYDAGLQSCKQSTRTQNRRNTYSGNAAPDFFADEADDV
jgi:hypothetical protein